MYFFVGKMMVLQPDKEHSFIAKDEPYHDMLPATPGLWVLRQPNEAAFSQKQAPSLAAMANDELADAGHAAVRPATSQKGRLHHAEGKGKGHKAILGGSSAKQASLALTTLDESPAAVTVANKPNGKPAASLREAVMDLMNYPHPLDTL